MSFSVKCGVPRSDERREYFAPPCFCGNCAAILFGATALHRFLHPRRCRLCRYWFSFLRPASRASAGTNLQVLRSYQRKKIRTHRGAPPLASGSCAWDGRSDSGKRGGMYRHAAPSRTARACVLSAGIPKGCPLWGIFGDFLCKQKVTRSGERNTPPFSATGEGLKAL